MHNDRPEAATSSRDAMEAQAEGIAYVVARSLGLETHSAVTSSMASLCRDTEALAQTLAAIQRGSAQILDELIPQPPAAGGAGVLSGPRDGPSVEPEDFARIQREYGDRLIESVAGFVGDRPRAEDLAARAFERAWEKREGFRGESSLRTWIEAIARNEARQDWRRARHVQVDSLDRTLARDWPAPELVTDELEKREEDRHLQEALAKLSIKPRRALIAHFVEGLSIRDIARRERVPEGTILSRIFTGKQLLREAWDAPIARPAAKVTALESPSLQPGRQGSPGPRRTEKERPDAPELTAWNR
jgi:RNA polymerase sigma-70 factor (ECF subfamily)